MVVKIDSVNSCGDWKLETSGYPIMFILIKHGILVGNYLLADNLTSIFLHFFVQCMLLTRESMSLQIEFAQHLKSKMTPWSNH